ncbi:hypothetical protein ACC680_34440, partial [Rhizobium ruizarguesonis]
LSSGLWFFLQKKKTNVGGRGVDSHPSHHDVCFQIDPCCIALSQNRLSKAIAMIAGRFFPAANR